MAKTRAYRGPKRNQRRTKPKPLAKKGRKPSPPVDYKSLAINEKEVESLLGIAEAFKGFPKGLIPRLNDLKEQFKDELGKLHELVKRNRSNAFYSEYPKLKKGADYTDVVALSASQMRRRLEQQRLERNSKNGSHKEV